MTLSNGQLANVVEANAAYIQGAVLGIAEGQKALNTVVHPRSSYMYKPQGDFVVDGFNGTSYTNTSLTTAPTTNSAQPVNTATTYDFPMAGFAYKNILTAPVSIPSPGSFITNGSGTWPLMSLDTLSNSELIIHTTTNLTAGGHASHVYLTNNAGSVHQIYGHTAGANETYNDTMRVLIFKTGSKIYNANNVINDDVVGGAGNLGLAGSWYLTFFLDTTGDSMTIDYIGLLGSHTSADIVSNVSIMPSVKNGGIITWAGNSVGSITGYLSSNSGTNWTVATQNTYTAISNASSGCCCKLTCALPTTLGSATFNGKKIYAYGGYFV